jgi:hypothetical protein
MKPDKVLEQIRDYVEQFPKEARRTVERHL